MIPWVNDQRVLDKRKNIALVLGDRHKIIMNSIASSSQLHVIIINKKNMNKELSEYILKHMKHLFIHKSYSFMRHFRQVEKIYLIYVDYMLQK